MIVKTFLTFLSLLVSCTSSPRGGGASIQEKKEPVVMTKYEMIAVEKFKDHIDYVFNETKTHVLCMKTNKATPKMPESTVTFFIFELKNEKIVLEESIVDGAVRWVNDRQMEIIQRTGTVSKNDPDRTKSYLFDLDSGKKTELPKDNNLESKQ
jgi:hypothetical protein